MPLLILALIGSMGGCGGDTSRTPTITLTPTTAPTSTLEPIPTPTPPEMLEANYTTHIDTQNGFSIAYPEDWHMRTTAYDVFAMQAPESCQGRSVIFYIQKLALTTETDTENYFGQILCDTFSSQDRYFMYGEKLGVSGRSAIVWVTSYEKIGGVPLKEMVYYVLDYKTAWTLSFTAAFICWKQYEAIFQHIIDSFLLL